ncbi:MAG TPA: alpha/beta fold hydrolase [Ktedonobacteraceae bacterium]
MSNRIKTTRREIQLGQQAIYYQVAGKEDGEPVVLVHGLSASSRWWVRNVPALAEHYRVYLLDLPGFGLMRRFRRRFVLDELSSSITAWMDALGINQAHMIGHSMGGYICLRIAARHPERIKRLVLVSPAGIPHIRSVRGYLLPLLVAIRYCKPAFLPILFSDALLTGPRTLLRATQDLLTKDIRDALHKVVTPTLLIWGEYDALVPPVFGDILREEIKGARLLILKRAGHVVMFDQAEEFNDAVLRFLEGETMEK